jgi:DNA-binding winged helix-turn-helix (wHTH) protein
VTQPARERRLFRFGVFEFDSSTGELRREGKSEPRLRDQAVQILSMLLDRPRELVTRDELRQELWPADTFVDFDHGLNTAINQLRNALGDSAANPRFIQTLPRRGYRFIAPVEIVGTASSTASATAADVRPSPQHSDAPAGAGARSSVLSGPNDLPAASSGIVRVLFSLIQIMYLTFYVLALARSRQVDAILQEVGWRGHWIFVLIVLTAAVGIPVRLYLITAAAFGYRGLAQKFLKLFPFVFPFDEIWALAPFLLVGQVGLGLAIAFSAALLYVPFAQRSLLLMAHSSSRD